MSDTAYNAVRAIEDEATGAIEGAVEAARQSVAAVAGSIEDVARETVDKSIMRSLTDLHGIVGQLVSRQNANDALIPEIHANQSAMKSALDAITQPVTQATQALADVANAVASEATAGVSEAEDAAAGVAVSVQDVVSEPKTTGKKLFKKKKR